MQQILASHEASDRHFLELEQKRMKFEEYITVDKDQQKHEEREFRLKMMPMMMQGPPPPIPPYYLSPAVTWTLRISIVLQWAHPG